MLITKIKHAYIVLLLVLDTCQTALEPTSQIQYQELVLLYVLLGIMHKHHLNIASLLVLDHNLLIPKPEHVLQHVLNTILLWMSMPANKYVYSFALNLTTLRILQKVV